MGAAKRFTGLLRRITSWFKDRFALTPIAEFVLYRRVTDTPWYYGAGAAMVLLLLVLVATGAVLALDYSPSSEHARRSVAAISNVHVLGWFVRGMHYWSAGMMVVCIVYHMFRQITLGGYKPPREGLWLIGVVLFILVMINAFTGYTLRWDERGVTAVRVALNMLYNVPLIGEDLVRVVQGGDSIGSATVSRLFTVHVLLVPMALLPLVGFHLYLVISHGVTTEAERRQPVATAHEQRAVHDQAKKSPTEGTDFYPWTAAESAAFAFAVFAVAVSLALVFGAPPVGIEPNSKINSMPKEEWWFHWVSGLVALLPPEITPVFYVAFPVMLILILCLLPFVDRGTNRGVRRRPLAVIAVSIMVVALLALTGYRLRSPFTAWPTTALPPVPAGLTMTESVEEGRRLFAKFGCFTCHAIGGHGSGVGPNLTALEARLSPDELRYFIRQPPTGIAMPAYQGRLSPAELDRIVEFVLVAQTFPREFESNDP